MAYEGVLVTTSDLVRSSSFANHFGWLSPQVWSAQVTIVATHSFMRAVRQGALNGLTLSVNAPSGGFSIRGVLVGSPATGNLFTAINPPSQTAWESG